MKDKAEETITTELAKQNVTEAVIAKLKTDYLPLKINGIEDKEGYKKVHDARIVCRDHRVLAKKICKAGREDAIKEQKAWIAKEKEVVAKISEVEQHLKKQEDAIDKIIEDQKLRAERLLKLPGRKEQIVGIEEWVGKVEMVLHAYKPNEIGSLITDEIIMRFDNNQWDNIILLAKSMKLDYEQKKIDDAKADERLKQLTERTNLLYAISVSMRSNNGKKEFSKGDVHYTEDEIAAMSQEEWDRVCSEFKFAIIPPKTNTEAIKAGNELFSRQQDPDIFNNANVSEISDEEKLFNYASALEKVPVPEMKTEIGKKALAEAADFLSNAIYMLRK